mmetsp:Transcript_19917/g.43284  ORF Transcript_19917/g.43284 Transcript_19917/m.43284 type:complete len:822 (+) Transcript_19917:256-2721(+)
MVPSIPTTRAGVDADVVGHISDGSDNFDDSYLSKRVRDEATENERRCQQILECKHHIDYWKAKLDVLEKEQTTKIKLARMRLDAESTWKSLSSRDRKEKKFILAAMESSKELPSVLDDFPSSNLPPSIRMDKDILLARVARNDFGGKYDDDRLFVPPKLRGDKEVVLAIIPKHCAVVECMSSNLRDDPEVFLAVLAAAALNNDNTTATNSANSATTPLPAYVLQHFSHRIRSNENLVLQLCAHRNGISSMGFVASDLRNNKAFLQKVIEVSYSNSDSGGGTAGINTVCGNTKGSAVVVPEQPPPHLILRYASQRLQDDSEVVLEAVKKCGLNLKHASYNLRRDYTIALAAIQENGAAFKYCLPGEARDRLLSDRDLVLKHIVNKVASSTILKTCLDRYPADLEIVMEALGGPGGDHGADGLNRNGIAWSMLPPDLRDSKEFVKSAIARNPRLYLILPQSFREDFELASIVVRCDNIDDDLLFDVFEEFSRFFFDREAVMTLVKREWKTFNMLYTMLEFAPHCVRTDKDIMLEAIRSNPESYTLCSPELSMDLDIVLAAVQGSHENLYWVPDPVHFEHPEVVICAIQSCDQEEDLWSLSEYIYEAFWSDRNVVMAWLSRWGEWLVQMPDAFREDEELMLALIQPSWWNFFRSSIVLRRNKEFVLRAVAIDARVVEFLREDNDRELERLRYDDDLTLLAFSKDKRAIQYYSGGGDFEYMVSLTKRFRKRIEDSNTFRDVFLANVVAVRRPRRHRLRPQQHPTISDDDNDSDNDGPVCSLPLLNQGPHTVRYHSQLIASYLGLPDREELLMLQKASANLLHWGF